MMKQSKLIGLFLLIAVAMIGCSSILKPETQVVRIVETVEVERIVEVTRLVESGDESVVPPMPAAEETPTPTVTPFPTVQPTPYPTGQPGDFTRDDVEKVFEVWELVEQDFYGDLPADDVVVDAMIAAMVETLGDRFTNYFPPAVAERINDGFRGDFTGIGAYVNTNDAGQFYIVRPIKGTPAEAAGLAPGDIVLEVNGNSIQGMVTDEVVAIVRGPEGEEVVLHVLREGEDEPFDVTITRARIVVPQVEAQLRGDGRIGYVRLESFNQVATDQLTTAVDAMLSEGVEGLILDLRYNGGGLLSQAVSVGDIFLPAGDFLIVKDSDGSEENFTTQTGQAGEDIPLVLLINDSSASASEIIAGAFRDLDRATIIGTNTFGKGSVQTPYRLEDGSEFRVTIARFFSPADVEINGVGVAPDIEFDFVPEIIADENDQTIDRAVEFLLTGQ